MQPFSANEIMSSRVAMLVLALGTLALAIAKQLPSFWARCKASEKDVGDCLVRSANGAMERFATGDPAYHLESIRPLHVPHMHIANDGGLDVNLTDSIITGYDQAIIKHAKVDFEKKKFQFILDAPFIGVTGTYSIRGKILILPITGSGPLNITFVKPHIMYSFEYDLNERGSKQYIVPKNNEFTYEATRIDIRLDNLFNGDKRLGEEMNKFLNENWKEVNSELGMKLGEAMGGVFGGLLGNFFSKVPFSELFVE